jgi:hypothetical protein
MSTVDRPVEDELGLQLRTDHALDLPLEEASGFGPEWPESVGNEDPPLVPEYGLPVIVPRPDIAGFKAEVAADVFDVTRPEGPRRVEPPGRPEVAAGQEEADAVGRRAELVRPTEDGEREGEVDLSFDAGELRRGIEGLPLRRGEDVHSGHGRT